MREVFRRFDSVPELSSEQPSSLVSRFALAAGADGDLDVNRNDRDGLSGDGVFAIASGMSSAERRFAFLSGLRKSSGKIILGGVDCRSSSTRHSS